jgi:hypothetical protein
MKRRVSFATDTAPDRERSVSSPNCQRRLLSNGNGLLGANHIGEGVSGLVQTTFSGPSREQNGNQFCGGN